MKSDIMIVLQYIKLFILLSIIYIVPLFTGASIFRLREFCWIPLVIFTLYITPFIGSKILDERLGKKRFYISYITLILVISSTSGDLAGATNYPYFMFSIKGKDGVALAYMIPTIIIPIILISQP